MAANTLPIFPLVVRNVGLSIVASAAVTARTAIVGTTGLSLLFTAGANGSRVDQTTIAATGTTQAGVFTFWVFDGTTSRILQEVLITVVVGSTTVAGFSLVVPFTGLVLPSGYSLYCSSQIATQLVGCVTTGGDY